MKTGFIGPYLCENPNVNEQVDVRHCRRWCRCLLMVCCVQWFSSHPFFSLSPGLTRLCSLPPLAALLHLFPALSSTTSSIILLPPSLHPSPFPSITPSLYHPFFFPSFTISSLALHYNFSLFLRLLSCVCMIFPSISQIVNSPLLCLEKFPLCQLRVSLCARLKAAATFSLLYHHFPSLKCKQR